MDRYKYTLILLAAFLLCDSQLALAGPKTTINQVEDNSVDAGANEIFTSGIIPTGKVIKLRKFGCAIPEANNGSYVVVQWGNGSGWQTVRACVSQADFVLKKDFLGDGVKRFRIVRHNGHTSAQIMVYWIEAIIDDQ